MLSCYPDWGLSRRGNLRTTCKFHSHSQTGTIRCSLFLVLLVLPFLYEQLSPLLEPGDRKKRERERNRVTTQSKPWIIFTSGLWDGLTLSLILSSKNIKCINKLMVFEEEKECERMSKECQRAFPIPYQKDDWSSLTKISLLFHYYALYVWKIIAQCIYNEE